METSTCKGCGKKVIFAVDTEGKTQILDAIAPVFYAYVNSSGKNDCVRDEQAFVTHFATCPAANQFSKSAKKKGLNADTSKPSEKETN